MIVVDPGLNCTEQARKYYEYCYQAPSSNANAKIVPLRDVTLQGRPSKTHLFDTLQALKRKELDNGKPVYCTIGLEDYIIQK